MKDKYEKYMEYVKNNIQVSKWYGWKDLEIHNHKMLQLVFEKIQEERGSGNG